MSLLDLPDELLCAICDHIELESDFNAWIQSCRRFYGIFNDDLYCGTGDTASIICWAVTKDLESVIHRLMAAGFDPARHDMMHAVYLAAEHGRLEILKLFISQGVDIKLIQRPSLLGYAVEHGQEHIARFLLAESDYLDAKTYMDHIHAALKEAVKSARHGIVDELLASAGTFERPALRSLVFFAILHGHEPLVRKFMNLSPKIIEIEGDHRCYMPPLIRSSYQGWTGIVRILLEDGADVQFRNAHDKTPMWHAASRGHVEIVQLLLAVDNSEETVNSAIRGALFYGKADVVAFLLDNVASLELMEMRKEQTPMELAVEQNHTALANMLIERSIYVDEELMSSLRWAVRNGNKSLIGRLLDLGHCTGGNDSSSRLKELIYCAVQSHDAHPDLLHWLLENWLPPGWNRTTLIAAVDWDASDDNGVTALASAATKGHEKAVRLLLKYGADPNIKDKNGATALSLACQSGNVNVVRALLDDGTPTETWYRNSPSRCDKRNKIPRYEEYIDTPDNWNRTPLFFATVLGFEEIARLLLVRGSNAIETATCAGRTPLSVAAKYRRRALEMKGDYKLQFIWQWLRHPQTVSVSSKDAQTGNERASEEDELWCCEHCGVTFAVYTELLYCWDIDQVFQNRYCLECHSAGSICLDPSRWQPITTGVVTEEGALVPLSEDKLIDYYGGPHFETIEVQTVF